MGNSTYTSRGRKQRIQRYKIRAIWELVDSMIKSILPYACESWTPTKEENTKLQALFNEAKTTVLFLPKGTLMTSILNETGNIKIEYIMVKKQLLRVK